MSVHEINPTNHSQILLFFFKCRWCIPVLWFLVVVKYYRNVLFIFFLFFFNF
jgi:hypothetical protein